MTAISEILQKSKIRPISANFEIVMYPIWQSMRANFETGNLWSGHAHKILLVCAHH